jgi:hypothetical protein
MCFNGLFVAIRDDISIITNRNTKELDYHAQLSVTESLGSGHFHP